MSWNKKGDKLRETPKWLPRGTKVMIEVKFVPKETTLKDKWGPRKVNIIDTREYGLVYVSDKQLQEIVEILRTVNGKEPEVNWQNTTVEL